MSDFSLSWRDVASRLLDGSLGRRKLVAAGAAAVLALALGAGALALRTRTAAVELSLPRAAAGSAAPAEGTADGATAEPAGAGERPVAHAAGAVVHPGIYPLPVGARVADLLTAAGGPTADADLDAINLAAKISDGERVYVPRKGEVAPPSSAGGAATSDIVNLNTATLDELDSLPGVGPSTAQAILDYRQQHGRFRSVDQLLDVRGIGQAKLRQLRPRVRV